MDSKISVFVIKLNSSLLCFNEGAEVENKLIVLLYFGVYVPAFQLRALGMKCKEYIVSIQIAHTRLIMSEHLPGLLLER